jgi:hypothetical protein
MNPDLPQDENPAVEGEDSDGAQSEAQRSDSAESQASTDTQGFERPMTFGSIDKK